PRSPSLPRAPSTPAPPAQRFVLPVARAELDEDGRGGGGVAGEDELLPRPPRGSSLLHVEGVEVDVAPRRERPEVEEREAVAHEVRQQVLHLERAADPRPLDAIEAVVELRLVGAVPEVPGHAQGDTILIDVDPLDLLGRAGAGVHHDDGPLPTALGDAHEAVLVLKRGDACVVAVLHAAELDLDAP